MKPPAFQWIYPSSLDEALQALTDHQDVDVKAISGGQSLIPMMNFRVAQPEVLVDLNGIADLGLITEHADHIAIGALARHAEVKASPLVEKHLPLVRSAYAHVAHATIRNRGTIGGNIAHADPASEMPTVMMALDATFVLRSLAGTRSVPAADFFFGAFATAIEPDELLVEILIPKAAPAERFAFEEVSLRKGDFAICGVAVRLSWEGSECVAAAIALAGVSDVPIRAPATEAVVRGTQVLPEDVSAAAEATVGAIAFNDTATVTAAYRAKLTRALIARALTRARPDEE